MPSVAFNTTDGSSPTGGLINDNGTLIGVAESGGSAGHGSVFSVDPTTLAINTLVSFNGAHTTNSGGVPFGSLSVDADGNVYGASQGEGGLTTILWELTGLNASQLSFVAQPQPVAAGATLPPVTVAAPTGSLVTLALDANEAGVTLPGGTASETAVNGLATFTDLSIATPGTYSLVATSGGVRVTSDPFSVSAAGSTPTGTPTPTPTSTPTPTPTPYPHIHFDPDPDPDPDPIAGEGPGYRAKVPEGAQEGNQGPGCQLQRRTRAGSGSEPGRIPSRHASARPRRSPASARPSRWH